MTPPARPSTASDDGRSAAFVELTLAAAAFPALPLFVAAIAPAEPTCRRAGSEAFRWLARLTARLWRPRQTSPVGHGPVAGP